VTDIKIRNIDSDGHKGLDGHNRAKQRPRRGRAMHNCQMQATCCSANEEFDLFGYVLQQRRRTTGPPLLFLV
jgi:hypothetical protein